VDVGFSDNSSKNNGNKQTGSALNFEPMFELNMPSTSQALNNLFVRSGYGFGSQRSEYTTGATTTTTKYSTTTFCAGLGYNFFFHKGLSFTPIFEYDINTQKNKTSDVKTKYDGIDFSFGFRKFFKYDQNR
ncbi:MAG: hypothetical protein ABJA78_10685, partial [Ferruginibacter sp.]